MTTPDDKTLDDLVRDDWRDVPEYEGLYQVSSSGLVRALRFRNRYHDSALPIPRILRQNSARPYLRVQLCKNDVRKVWHVHTVVLLAFIGPRPSGTEAGHLDGDTRNNSATNLAWVTKKQNAAHRSIHGTQQRGESCYNAKLTADAVREIRATYRHRSKDANSRILAERFGVSKEHIQKIAAGKAWNHI